MQKSERMPEGGIMIDNIIQSNMSSSEFAAMADRKQQQYFGETDPTISQAEDCHWTELCKATKSYAMNNAISLFSEDCEVRNLDQFTSYESLIHYDSSHHNMKECLHINFYLKFFPLYVIKKKPNHYIKFTRPLNLNR